VEYPFAKANFLSNPQTANPEGIFIKLEVFQSA
jgi:hypothetical protein